MRSGGFGGKAIPHGEATHLAPHRSIDHRRMHLPTHLLVYSPIKSLTGRTLSSTQTNDHYVNTSGTSSLLDSGTSTDYLSKEYTHTIPDILTLPTSLVFPDRPTKLVLARPLFGVIVVKYHLAFRVYKHCGRLC